MIQILIDHGIFHLFSELLILQASELDKRTDVIPVFFVILTVRLKHAGKLVRHLLGNVVRHLIYKSVILKSAS